MSDILIITETEDGALSPTFAELVGASQVLDATNQRTSVLITGSGADEAAKLLGKFGIPKAYTFENAQIIAHGVASAAAGLISELKPGLVLMAENDLGRDLAPLLAGRMHTAAVTDTVNLKITGGEIIFTKPVYGGNAMADFIIETTPRIISLRQKAFAPANEDREVEVDVTPLDSEESDERVRLIDRIIQKEEGVRLEDAKVVVGGGRGLGGPEGFNQIKELADLLNGTVGASRPPCDQGWWPENTQIGITGKIIAPDLYVAIGISGSSQHLSGVSGAKTTVAINKDPEANIFKAATYGVIGDWKKILPALIDKMRDYSGRS